jgi:hypothetical protein
MDSSEIQSNESVATVVTEQPSQPRLSSKYERFEDIPESFREELFSVILDYSQQALSRSIQRDTALFLINQKFKDIIGA